MTSLQFPIFADYSQVQIFCLPMPPSFRFLLRFFSCSFCVFETPLRVRSSPVCSSSDMSPLPARTYSGPFVFLSFLCPKSYRLSMSPRSNPIFATVSRAAARYYELLPFPLFFYLWTSFLPGLFRDKVSSFLPRHMYPQEECCVPVYRRSPPYFFFVRPCFPPSFDVFSLLPVRVKTLFSSLSR